MMAVDKFDPKMDFKFSTYAHFWINQTIVRYISQQERIIRLPNQLNFDVYKYKAQVSKLNEKYGSLSNAEISENGIVEAKEEGQAEVSVVSVDNGISESIEKIKIRDLIKSLKLKLDSDSEIIFLENNENGFII